MKQCLISLWRVLVTKMKSIDLFKLWKIQLFLACNEVSVCFEGPFSLLLKDWSKKDFFMIFFNSESWDSILFRSDIGGTAGGLGEAVFYFETFDFLKIFTLTSFTNIKIQPPQVPPRSPQCQTWKVWNLSFHWKKNHKKTFLDKFLSKSEKGTFSIFWYYHQL